MKEIKEILKENESFIEVWVSYAEFEFEQKQSYEQVDKIYKSLISFNKNKAKKCNLAYFYWLNFYIRQVNKGNINFMEIKDTLTSIINSFCENNKFELNYLILKKRFEQKILEEKQKILEKRNFLQKFSKPKPITYLSSKSILLYFITFCEGLLGYDSSFVTQMKFFKEINQKKLDFLKDN